MGEIKSLTSLRGLFAIWVVFFHLRAWSDLAEEPILFADRGYLAVDFFFLLSGFILASRHASEFVGGYRFPAHAAFAIKRFGRMFPLHLVVLAIVIARMQFRGEPQYWWTHIATEAALMHRWGLIHAPKGALNGPDWSISTEWAANLLFPVFVVVTGFAKNSTVQSTLFAAVAVLSVTLIEMHNGSLDVAAANSYLPLLRCFAEFGLGMVLFQRSAIFSRLAGDLAVMALVVGIIIGLVLRWDLMVVAIMVPLLPALAANNGVCSKVLSLRIFHGIGTISYSIYLIQLPLLLMIDSLTNGRPFAPEIHWIATPVIILLCAAATYCVIEKPANRWIRSLSSLVSARQVRI
jgi:peptidoglycan/LPS O-acetylase OafA/YrhL